MVSRELEVLEDEGREAPASSSEGDQSLETADSLLALRKLRILALTQVGDLDLAESAVFNALRGLQKESRELSSTNMVRAVVAALQGLQYRETRDLAVDGNGGVAGILTDLTPSARLVVGLATVYELDAAGTADLMGLPISRVNELLSEAIDKFSGL